MAATRLLVGSGELLQPLWRRLPLGKARVVLQEEHGRVVDGLVVHFLPVGKGSCSGEGTDWPAHSACQPDLPSFPCCPGTYFLQMCWEPLRYSCSKAGKISWWRLKRLCSIRVSAGVGGSRHSGMNTMKDKGSGELSSSFCGRESMGWR